MQQNRRYHFFFSYSIHSSSFLKPGAYITHNATQPLSDITGGNLSDYTQPRKTSCYFFTNTLGLLKAGKHNLICRIGECSLVLFCFCHYFFLYRSLAYTWQIRAKRKYISSWFFFNNISENILHTCQTLKYLLSDPSVHHLRTDKRRHSRSYYYCLNFQNYSV